MRISFDFDGTLENPKIQVIAEALIKDNHEVYIITSRYQDATRYSFKTSNSDIYQVASELNIPNDCIIFTNMEWKAATLINEKIQLHFEDNPDEIEEAELACMKALYYDLKFVKV